MILHQFLSANELFYSLLIEQHTQIWANQSTHCPLCPSSNAHEYQRSVCGGKKLAAEIDLHRLKLDCRPSCSFHEAQCILGFDSIYPIPLVTPVYDLSYSQM